MIQLTRYKMILFYRIFYRRESRRGFQFQILLTGFLFFSFLSGEGILQDFFKKRGYRLKVDGSREIYYHEVGLEWEFQPFNKLFKVDKYVYFFRELPTLKNNRIWINQEDFDFFNKVLAYYEEKKGVREQKDTEEAKPPGRVEKSSLVQEGKTEKIGSLPTESPPQKAIGSTGSEPPRTTDRSEQVREENSIDDLYAVDKVHKIDYVFIDPGHGGRDPGATFYGYVEKDLTLSLSKELAETLKKNNPDFKIVLTRTDDTYLSLEQRCAFANQTLKPEENGIFISVHLNVWVDPQARGIEVYYLTGSEEVIQKKTYRHLEDLAGTQEGYFKKIFSYFKVIQYQMESRYLSYQIIKNIESNVKASVPRGYKDETFYILKGVLMPSVLMELGFISNREDMELLNDKDKRQKILNQVSTAVIRYTEDFKQSNGFRDDFYFDKFLTLD